ncbi:MAG: hypothetical protein B6230_03325 [Desulfobacteraceae bacterium 4572_89]|nr:MAG: hypothetical protein B6230_03325 [Desulfobacteraceae bacterium 4572_89]
MKNQEFLKLFWGFQQGRNIVFFKSCVWIQEISFNIIIDFYYGQYLNLRNSIVVKNPLEIEKIYKGKKTSINFIKKGKVLLYKNLNLFTKKQDDPKISNK